MTIYITKQPIMFVMNSHTPPTPHTPKVKKLTNYVVDDTPEMVVVFRTILDMPYYKNYAAESGAVHNINNHECAIKDVFIKHDLKPYTPAASIHKKDIYKETFLSDMGACSFIEQPFGTHNSPDFIVKTPISNLLFVECKTATNTKPLYNSGGVDPNYIYIFSSELTNSTTIYKGSSIITTEQYQCIQKHIEEAREKDKLLNEQLSKLDTNHRGISYYTRPMINQSGGSTFTNYMTHENRARDEQTAIDYIASL